MQTSLVAKNYKLILMGTVNSGEEQNYNNHIRWYIPHHFIFYPLAIGSAVVSARFSYAYRHETLLWIAVAGIFLLLTWLAYMTRQHYALGNQNRIVRLEMRLRYYQLTQERLEPMEDRLSSSQMAA